MYITVSANVTDETGANVYVAAFESNIDKENWKTNIENGQWDLGNLSTHLGSASGGESLTFLTGNVHVAYANLEDQTPIPVNVSTVYYMYLYAVDPLNNSVSVAYDTTVSIDVNTTTVVAFDDFMQYVTNPPAVGTVAQLRDYVAPNVDYSGAFFRFYEQTDFPEWDKKWYANIHVNPEESVITGNVYTIAVEKETEAPTLSDVANLINNNLDATRVYDGTPFYNATIEQMNEEIHMFYPNVDPGVSNVDMAFGKTYYVYSMVKDVGFQNDVVKQNAEVTTGTPPNVNTVNVTVVKTV